MTRSPCVTVVATATAAAAGRALLRRADGAGNATGTAVVVCVALLAAIGSSRRICAAGLSCLSAMKEAWRTWPAGVHSANDTSATAWGRSHSSCPSPRRGRRARIADAGVSDGAANGEVLRCNGTRRWRSARACAWFQPVPTLPACCNAPCASNTPRSRLPISTVLPWRRVKPPTTNSCRRRHFSLSHASLRPLLYGASRLLAIRPSPPALHTRFSAATAGPGVSALKCSGPPRGPCASNFFSSPRRCSSAVLRRSWPSKYGRSNNQYSSAVAVPPAATPSKAFCRRLKSASPLAPRATTSPSNHAVPAGSASSAAASAGILALQSWPLRVNSRARPACKWPSTR